jgi:signal peptidase I
VTSPAPPKSRSRAPDYRLRGLDLDAHAFTEAPSRAVWKRHPSRRRRRRRHVIQFALVLAVVALVAVGLRASVVEPFSVTSASMEPTVPSGTNVLVVKWDLLTGPVERGDVVVVDTPAGVRCNPDGDADHLIARVIAYPGETITSVRGRIYLDGRRFHEPGWYSARYGETGPADIAPTTVPPNSYFVLGDNRHQGCDSRAFGAIPRSSVIGEVVATISHDGHASVHFI